MVAYKSQFVTLSHVIEARANATCCEKVFCWHTQLHKHSNVRCSSCSNIAFNSVSFKTMKSSFVFVGPTDWQEFWGKVQLLCAPPRPEISVYKHRENRIAAFLFIQWSHVASKSQQIQQRVAVGVVVSSCEPLLGNKRGLSNFTESALVERTSVLTHLHTFLFLLASWVERFLFFFILIFRVDGTGGIWGNLKPLLNASMFIRRGISPCASTELALCW